MNGDVAHGQPANAEPQVPDFDFWDFVSCGKCNLPYSSEGTNQPSIPFWVTECCHVVCNSHLNADQSCPVCKAPGIELMPVQKDLPSPMSDWFSHVPYRLDAMAQAARFQLESLGASVRYYKTRCAQYRSVCERLKGEVTAAKALRKELEALRSENEELRNGRGAPQSRQVAHHMLNANGKRPRENPSNGSFSSPRSITTPVGPSRITLPPIQDPPQLLAGSRPRQPDRSNQQPPGSSRFIEQYAYNPPQSAQISLHHQPVLSHAQKVPTKFLSKGERAMPPPPTPSYAQQMRRVSGSHPPSPDNMLPCSLSAFCPLHVSNSSSAFAPGQPPEFLPQDVSQQQTSGARAFQPRMATSSNYASMDSASRMPGGNGRRFVPPNFIGTEAAATNRITTSSGPAASTPSTFGHAAGQTRRFVPATSSNPSANVYGGVEGDSSTGNHQQRFTQRQRTSFIPTSRAGFS